MNRKNEIPILFRHTLEGFITDDTRICNKHMDSAKLF
jgi:hypothetical protein